MSMFYALNENDNKIFLIQTTVLFAALKRPMYRVLHPLPICTLTASKIVISAFAIAQENSSCLAQENSSCLSQDLIIFFISAIVTLQYLYY
jgi:hypothetical protein